jgi:hypothetical protein
VVMLVVTLLVLYFTMRVPYVGPVLALLLLIAGTGGILLAAHIPRAAATAPTAASAGAQNAG